MTLSPSAIFLIKQEYCTESYRQLQSRLGILKEGEQFRQLPANRREGD